MKKTAKVLVSILASILVLCILTLLLSGIFIKKIYKPYTGKRPCDQPNTTWVSEDGMIRIDVDNVGVCSGTIQTAEGEIPFYMSIGPATQMWLSDPEENETSITYTEGLDEYWYGKNHKEDRFTAVVKESAFFEIGQTIRFLKVDG